MYPIEIKPASKSGYHTPAEAKAYYGRYARDGVTVHWWDKPEKAGTHDATVNYILGKAAKGTGSVNYVSSNDKITMLVNPDDVAWASQSGNPTTVSIEFDPRLNDEGYKKGGWVIWQLEQRYNKKLALYPHKYWYATECPGNLSLDRLREEANRWATGYYSPKPPVTPPTPTGADISWERMAAPADFVVNKDTNLWNFNSVTWGGIKPVKAFKKGDLITIAGKARNNTLKAEYLLTAYSFDNRITNGFNKVDLDPYVKPAPPADPAPVPIPPPIQQPTPPPQTQPPVDPDMSAFEKRLNALEAIVKAITDFLDKIFKWR